jgi:hypothetical protein
MEQRGRAPFAGMSRIRFQGTFSIQGVRGQAGPKPAPWIPLADPGIVTEGLRRSMARVML